MTHRPIDIDPSALCPGCFQADYPRIRCAGCGFRPSDQTHLLALPHGSLLGKVYFVGKILGRPGGFGITYLAWDRTLQMRVAIKEYLPRELAHRDTASNTVTAYSHADAELYHKGLEQFLQEARLLAQFNHPNIVRVRTYLEENATAYLVMDFVEGRTLEEYVHSQGGQLKEDLAIRMLLPVLDGLRALHSKDIVHRDIKPQNIYLAEDKIPVLLDFGAARSILGSHGRSLSVIGTPGFMPPEQFHGTTQQGPWTDVYGLAATLFYLVEGKTFSRVGMDSSMHSAEKERTFTRTSDRLRRILQKALAADPSERVQNAEQLLTELLAIAEPRKTVYSESSTASEISKDRHISPLRHLLAFGWISTSTSALRQITDDISYALQKTYSRHRVFFIGLPMLLLLLWISYTLLDPSEEETENHTLILPSSEPTEVAEEMTADEVGETIPRPIGKRESVERSTPSRARETIWAPSAEAIIKDVLRHDYRFQTGYTSSEVREKLKEIRRRPGVLDETIRRWREIPLPLFNDRTEEEIRKAMKKRF